MLLYIHDQNQLKRCKETGLSCILREGRYCFTNNTNKILTFYIYAFLLYPMFKILNFSMLTVSWLEWKQSPTIRDFVSQPA